MCVFCVYVLACICIFIYASVRSLLPHAYTHINTPFSPHTHTYICMTMRVVIVTVLQNQTQFCLFGSCEIKIKSIFIPSLQYKTKINLFCRTNLVYTRMCVTVMLKKQKTESYVLVKGQQAHIHSELWTNEAPNYSNLVMHPEEAHLSVAACSRFLCASQCHQHRLWLVDKVSFSLPPSSSFCHTLSPPSSRFFAFSLFRLLTLSLSHSLTVSL